MAKKKAHGPKRHGETFAQQLMRERATRIADGLEVKEKTKNIAAQDLMKFFVIAANNAWGIGGERMRRFVDEVYKVSQEFDDLARSSEDEEECDFDYARDVMDRRIQQIFGDEPVEFRLRY